MRILIIDDEPLIVEGLRASLEDGENTLEVAYCGEDAIRIAREFKPDLMLMDVRLPDISGIEVAAELEKTQLCPVVFLTAYSDSAIIDRAKDLKGVHGYLVKPVDERTLRSTIAIAMAKFKEHRDMERNLKKAELSLKERKIIERAKGLLMENMNISEPKAMETLQRQSKNQNKKLIETAKWVIEFFSGGNRD